MRDPEARPRVGASAVLIALLLALAGAEPAGAQTPGVTINNKPPADPIQQNMPRSWYRNYDYGVEIDGKISESVGLFQIVGKPLMLIYGPGMAKGWVLSMNPKEVRPVDSGAITVKGDLELVLAESAFMAAPPSPWANDGPTAVVFYGDRARIRVARVPDVVGETTPEAICENNPMYRRGMEHYTPEAAAVDRLKKVSSPYTIEVWFGSWCPHCQRVVPRLMKVLEAVSNPNVAVLYHGVPRQFGEYQPAMKKDVSGLPTFIVMRNGREYTRFKGGGEKQSIEAELAEILAGSTAPAGS